MDKHLPTLIVCVGLPYSGKSTWSSAYGAPIVSPDEIRRHVHGDRFVPAAEGLVWWVTAVMVRSLFSSGHQEVILDACSVSVKRRSWWKTDEWNSRYAVFDVSKETCIERARMVNDEAIVPVIERMANEWEPLTMAEAFSAFEPEPVLT